ncbi:MAG: LLM class flavin-dependent oxidoreductase [Alphaproteobacteria bacterium]|nr:LLM class flavin-dependent oxidoreductase [Alphaproteobacteria bacterium]
MIKQMHVTGFMIYCPAPHMIMSWVYPREKIRHQWTDVEYWVEIAQTLERGKMDMFFFADGWGGGTNDASVRYAIQFPASDPVSLVPYLAAVTKKLGLAVTMSTTFYPPFMLARKLATLDHITKGRIGWNIVTSVSRGEARNFGMDDMPPHDERYDRADEYMEVVNKLWESWDDDALLMDMENGIFADPAKVHKIDHAGQYYNVQGPLTVTPSPQRKPYIFQAGASERGRDFAARHAECVFAVANNTQQMRSFCDDIATRAEKYGRDPGQIKIIWGAQPLVAHSHSEALARQQEIRARIPIEASLALLGGHLNYNLNTLDIDLPIADLNLKITGIQGMLEAAVKVDPNVTLRKMASTYLSGSDNGPMIGTAKQVADHMVYLMEEGGGDGFQITPSYYGPDYFADLNQMLIPELQRRGVFRTEYNGTTLRDYMNEDAPVRAAE